MARYDVYIQCCIEAKDTADPLQHVDDAVTWLSMYGAKIKHVQIEKVMD